MGREMPGGDARRSTIAIIVIVIVIIVPFTKLLTFRLL